MLSAVDVPWLGEDAMYDDVAPGTLAGGAVLSLTGAYAWLGPLIAGALVLLFVGVVFLKLHKD
jgi:hypothetical protein